MGLIDIPRAFSGLCPKHAPAPVAFQIQFEGQYRSDVVL
jgi:hypothetical protein